MTAAPSRARTRLIAFAASCAACLVIAELAVRVTQGAPLSERLPLMKMRANPQRGWEMVPGQTHYTYLEKVEVNALGLRGPEIAPKRPGEQRLLYLGDSLIYGQGVADGETQPAQLERALRARAAGVEWSVVNAGHRSYGTSQELALLAELGASIQPDVVLLGWYWNDVDERDVARTYERLADKGELYFDTGNRLEGMERVDWYAKQLLRKSALVMFLHDVTAPRGSPYGAEYLDLVWQRTGRNLARMETLCAGLGARPVVVIVPDAHRIEGGDTTRVFEEHMAELARERGLPVIELLPALAALHERTRRVPVLPFDGHYDPEGNRVMAEYLAERLLALGLARSD